MIGSILTGITIGSLTTLAILRKIIKETKRKEKAIQTLSEDLGQTIKELMEGKRVQKLDLSELPRNIKTDIFKKKSILKDLFFEGSDKDGHKPPFLLLIKPDMSAVIKHGIKEGRLLMKGKDKKRTKKELIISHQKLIRIKMPNGQTYPFYLGFENSSELYPHKPGHLAEQLYNIVLALQMAKTGQGTKKKFPKILLILIPLLLGGIGFGIYMLIKAFSGNTTPDPIITQAPEQIVNIINNSINGSINASQIPPGEFKQVIV